MTWFAIAVLAIVVAVFLGAAKASNGGVKALQGKSPSRSDGESNGKTFLPPIPKGFQIYQSRLNPAGMQYRKEAAFDFAMRAFDDDPALSLVREPDNPHDKNAIAVHGVISGKRWSLGYIPAEIANEIVSGGIFNEVKPRLERIWVQSPSSGSSSYIEITFQLLAPKARVKEQREAQRQQLEAEKTKPATADQKKCLRFFNLPIPKGLTVGGADQLIALHKTTLRAAQDPTLEDWEGLEMIEGEFDDKDFRETYDIKSVSNALLKQALDALQAEGKTLRYLATNEEEIVKKLFELKPDLERQMR